MNSFHGKKLLILGDNPESAPLVETANDMGVQTIVTGINQNTKPKKIAWKSVDINALDVDAMERLAHQEAIDAVMVGVADILVPSYTALCNRLRLPCYSNMEAATCLSNKSLFKEQLRKVGLPVVPEYPIEDFNRDSLSYPVVVKPVDSGGGCGISIVENKEGLKTAIEKARANSRSGQIQIEKLMNGDVVACYYTIIDGHVYLSSLEDNCFTKKQGALCPVTTGHYYASHYLDDYFERYHGKICDLLNAIHVKNGILQINAFVVNGEFFFYDPGYRFQGEAQHHILNAVNGFDHKEMMVEFAFTGKMFDGDFETVNDPWLHGKKCASVWILLKFGKIGQIKGMSEVIQDKRVVYHAQRLFEGDSITDSMLGTEKQVLTRIYLVCDDTTSLNDMIRDIRQCVVIKDIDGKDMLLDVLDCP